MEDRTHTLPPIQGTWLKADGTECIITLYCLVNYSVGKVVNVQEAETLLLPTHLTI